MRAKPYCDPDPVKKAPDYVDPQRAIYEDTTPLLPQPFPVGSDAVAIDCELWPAWLENTDQPIPTGADVTRPAGWLTLAYDWDSLNLPPDVLYNIAVRQIEDPSMLVELIRCSSIFTGGCTLSTAESLVELSAWLGIEIETAEQLADLYTTIKTSANDQAMSSALAELQCVWCSDPIDESCPEPAEEASISLPACAYESPISQDDANARAEAQVLVDLICVFCNPEDTYTCAEFSLGSDGTPNSYTVEAKKYCIPSSAYNDSVANAAALQEALDLAEAWALANLVCQHGNDPGGCGCPDLETGTCGGADGGAFSLNPSTVESGLAGNPITYGSNLFFGATKEEADLQACFACLALLDCYYCNTEISETCPENRYRIVDIGKLNEQDCVPAPDPEEPPGVDPLNPPYIIPACKYRSTISQEDADALAQAELDANLICYFCNAPDDFTCQENCPGTPEDRPCVQGDVRYPYIDAGTGGGVEPSCSNANRGPTDPNFESIPYHIPRCKHYSADSMALVDCMVENDVLANLICHFCSDPVNYDCAEGGVPANTVEFAPACAFTSDISKACATSLAEAARDAEQICAYTATQVAACVCHYDDRAKRLGGNSNDETIFGTQGDVPPLPEDEETWPVGEDPFPCLQKRTVCAATIEELPPVDGPGEGQPGTRCRFALSTPPPEDPDNENQCDFVPGTDVPTATATYTSNSSMEDAEEQACAIAAGSLVCLHSNWARGYRKCDGLPYDDDYGDYGIVPGFSPRDTFTADTQEDANKQAEVAAMVGMYCPPSERQLIVDKYDSGSNFSAAGATWGCRPFKPYSIVANESNTEISFRLCPGLLIEHLRRATVLGGATVKEHSIVNMNDTFSLMSSQMLVLRYGVDEVCKVDTTRPIELVAVDAANGLDENEPPVPPGPDEGMVGSIGTKVIPIIKVEIEEGEIKLYPEVSENVIHKPEFETMINIPASPYFSDDEEDESASRAFRVLKGYQEYEDTENAIGGDRFVFRKLAAKGGAAIALENDVLVIRAGAEGDIPLKAIYNVVEGTIAVRGCYWQLGASGDWQILADKSPASGVYAYLVIEQNAALDVTNFSIQITHTPKSPILELNESSPYNVLVANVLIAKVESAAIVQYLTGNVTLGVWQDGGSVTRWPDLRGGNPPPIVSSP